MQERNITLDILRQKDWIIFETISGSIAYGTNIEGVSDVDIRGVFIQPTEHLLTYGRIDQISDTKNDILFYEIGRFIELLEKSNPNVLEYLFIDEKHIIYQSPKWKEYFPNPKKYFSKQLEKTFGGYAVSQIKKARGLNKKMNWEKERVKRKTPLDFCYVLLEKEKSVKLKKWLEIFNESISDQYRINDQMIGLAKVNNLPNIYSMYLLADGGGIIGENSNDVVLKTIPKHTLWLGYLRFSKDKYSQHCKDYASYQKWIEERNQHRYKTNVKHGGQMDAKNLMHCVRLLETVCDIFVKGDMIVERPNKEYLLKIRNGKVDFEQLLDQAEKTLLLLKKFSEISDFPKNIKKDYNLIKRIRLESL